MLTISATDEFSAAQQKENVCSNGSVFVLLTRSKTNALPQNDLKLFLKLLWPESYF